MSPGVQPSEKIWLQNVLCSGFKRTTFCWWQWCQHLPKWRDGGQHFFDLVTKLLHLIHPIIEWPGLSYQEGISDASALWEAGLVEVTAAHSPSLDVLVSQCARHGLQKPGYNWRSFSGKYVFPKYWTKQRKKSKDLVLFKDLLSCIVEVLEDSLENV